MQTTSQLLMIRPVNFGYNAETAVNNAFQVQGNNDDAQTKALLEFDQFVSVLRAHDVSVTVVDDTPEPHTPDSIFPNNWISFHQDGTVIFYPMFASNRRLERKQHVIDAVTSAFDVQKQIDLSSYEAEQVFLEGTGSMVLDRAAKLAYACLSPRTNTKVLKDFCNQTGYTAVEFTATDNNGLQIYHTNVMMCVADRFAVVCLDAIPDPGEKKYLRSVLTGSGKEIVTITLDQMNRFAGNMLQVENSRGDKLLVMSSQAYASLTTAQVKALETYGKLLHSALTTIETNGGGSARCMMAEIHLPVNRKKQ